MAQDFAETEDMQRPNVFEYLDYREFVDQALRWIEKTEKVLRKDLTERAGFVSTSYWSMVLKKQRNLTSKSAAKVAIALKLGRAESDFFIDLVEFNQAVDLLAKDRAYKKLLGHKRFFDIQKLTPSQYELFSSWINVAVLEALSTRLAKQSIEDIAKALDISVDQAEAAIEVLMKMGLVEKKGEVFRKVNKALTTEPETQSLAVRNYHRGMLSKAIKSLDRVQSPLRSMQGLTIPARVEDLAKLSKRIEEFVSEIAAELGSDEADSDFLIQVNAHFFPLARLTTTKSQTK